MSCSNQLNEMRRYFGLRSIQHMHKQSSWEQATETGGPLVKIFLSRISLSHWGFIPGAQGHWGKISGAKRSRARSH